MSTGEDHRTAAANAYAAATALRADHPEWAVVPLFYAAMHLLHAWLDERANVPVDQRHPEQHTSYRSGGQIIRWGTNDVVARWCPPAVSRAYKSLFNAGRVMRYSLAPYLGGGADQRLWDDYATIEAFVGPPPP